MSEKINNDELLVEDDAIDQVSSDDVKAYLNAAEKESDQGQQNSQDSELLPSVDEKTGDTVIRFGQDTTFDTSRDGGTTEYDKLHINIQDDAIPITQQEKEDYLLAMLNEEQYEQDVLMFNKLTVRCRDLNVYEKQVVQKVVTDQLHQNQDIVPAAFFMLLRQCRVPMQVMAVNGKPMDIIRFQYEPSGTDEEQLQKDADQLLKRSRQLLYNTPVARYDIYLKALNVFENKIVRLQEAAFNENFWNPADQD